MTTLPWNLFKQVVLLMGKRFHYVESPDQYYIFTDNADCFVNKTPSSDAIVDWESNYKSVANDPESQLNIVQGGRLKTTSVIESPVTVSQVEPTYISSYLLSGASSEMAVNGSSVNVNFTTPSFNNGEIYYLKSISVHLMDDAIPSGIQLGGLAALTNGAQIKVRTKGAEYVIDNIKDGPGLYASFSANPVYHILPGTGIAPVDRFAYIGTMLFSQPIVLKGENNDYVRVTIRDNMTALTTFKMKISAYRGI